MFALVIATSSLAAAEKPDGNSKAKKTRKAKKPTTPVSPGEWRRIEFQGNDTFTDSQLQSALLGDSDFLLACHPSELEVDMQHLTKRLLVKGYHKAGFADVSMERSVEAKPRVVYVLKEGPRYRYGDVQVNGVSPATAESLTRWMTERHPPLKSFPTFVTVNGHDDVRWIDEDGDPADMEGPVWNAGEIASFDTESRLRDYVASALKGQGFSKAFVFVKIVPSENDHTAKLVIDVVSMGEPDRAQEVVITGLKINTRESLLKYIGMTQGDSVNREHIRRMTERLWECGRFTKHRIRFDHETDKLTIELEEFPG